MRMTFVRLGFLLSVVTFGKACGPSEYKSASGECCLMCNIGSVVHSDCSGDLSTTCKRCPPGTFISEPNDLHKCFTCRNCVESQGLYIQRTCTTIKDTMCDVLDGYYCIDYSDSQCHHAQKHSVCEPGQETKTPGTKSLDAICVNCPHGFFSPSGLSCTKWTDCTARNEIQTEMGSSVKDVTCTPKRLGRYGLILPVATSLFFIILYLWLMYKRRKTVKNKLFPKNLLDLQWSSCDSIAVFSVCCDLDVVEKLEVLRHREL